MSASDNNYNVVHQIANKPDTRRVAGVLTMGEAPDLADYARWGIDSTVILEQKWKRLRQGLVFMIVTSQ